MISNTIIRDNILLLKKLSKDFSKYTIVGIFITIANVFLMWLFIDILKIHTLLASSIVVGGLHVVGVLFILRFVFF